MIVLDNLLEWLTPHDCLGCGVEGLLLCDGCAAVLPSARTAKIRSATIYTGVAKDLVWRLKFDGAHSAAQIMARQMLPLLPKQGVLVPVPTTTLRRRQRGYDQTILLAQELSRLSGLPVGRWLARSGQQHQIGADRMQRRLQLLGVYRLTRRARPVDKHIILIDDVVTTGATLEAVTVTVHAAGAAHVTAITFAQA
jgi:ComF family protein